MTFLLPTSAGNDVEWSDTSDYHLSWTQSSVSVTRVAFSSESPELCEPFGLCEHLGLENNWETRAALVMCFVLQTKLIADTCEHPGAAVFYKTFGESLA